MGGATTRGRRKRTPTAAALFPRERAWRRSRSPTDGTVPTTSSTATSPTRRIPVPYRPRPVSPTYPGGGWPAWLVQDQRFVQHRPDVLTWETEPLRAGRDGRRRRRGASVRVDDRDRQRLGREADRRVPGRLSERRRDGRIPAHDRGRVFRAPVSQELRDSPRP